MKTLSGIIAATGLASGIALLAAACNGQPTPPPTPLQEPPRELKCLSVTESAGPVTTGMSTDFATPCDDLNRGESFIDGKPIIDLFGSVVVRARYEPTIIITKGITPQDACEALKRKEVVPIGDSFVIRDLYDGKLTDVAKVKVPEDVLSRGELDATVLVKTRSGYIVEVSGITTKGVMVTYGPERCVELPAQSFLTQKLNPHMYGRNGTLKPSYTPKKLGVQHF